MARPQILPKKYQSKYFLLMEFQIVESMMAKLNLSYLVMKKAMLRL